MEGASCEACELHFTGKIALTPGHSETRGRFLANSRQDRPRGVRVLGARAILPVEGGPEHVASLIAAVQRGRVGRRQLLQAAIASSTVSYLLERDRLHHEAFAGVYTVGPPLEIPWARETAALLAIHRSILSHASVAAQWGLCPHPGADAPVDVTVAGHRTGHRRGINAHHSLTLTAKDVVIHQGLPVTVPARALLDFAEDRPAREVERALDEALAQRLVSLTKIHDQLERSGAGRKGAAILGELIASRRPSSITRSEAEERLHHMLRQAGIPSPQCNVPLHGFVVDFLWPNARLVVEIDGYQWHSTRSAWQRDRRKDAVLQANGYLVIRLSWEDITQEPLAVIARIVRALSERLAAA